MGFSKLNKSSWPSAVELSGLPFMLCGWNAEFILTGEYEGYPVYTLEPYNICCLYPIAGGRILRYKGKWIFQRDHTYEGCHFIGKLSDQDNGPMGTWIAEYDNKIINLLVSEC